MNKKKPRCMQCLPWHCQSVLILWHFNCSLDFFNFSLRGTQIHPKKPAFLRPIKSFIFLKYMPILHLLPSQALVSGNFFLPRYYIYYKVCNRSFVKNLGHRDFRVLSTRRTPACRNGLHHLKLR